MGQIINFGVSDNNAFRNKYFDWQQLIRRRSLFVFTISKKSWQTGGRADARLKNIFFFE